MVSREAASLVHSFNPDARMIAMVRNPIEVAHALHGERVSHGVEDIVDFADALAADDDRMAERRLPSGSTPLGATYVTTTLFAEQLGRWFDEFGRERVHVIVFDDFASATEASFDDVLRFLEVDRAYRPSSFEIHNPSHRIRRGVMGRLRAGPLGRRLRQLAARTLGESRATRLARDVRHSRLARTRSTREALPADVRQRLEKRFAADVEKLGSMIDRDLAALWFRRQP
jgi:hypothetical protein